jgi:hypothetical protein
MDSPVPVRPAGNGPEGETGTTVRYQKTGGFLKPEGALIPPPKDAVQHRMGVEVHVVLFMIYAVILVRAQNKYLSPF